MANTKFMNEPDKIAKIPFGFNVARKLPLPHKYGILDKLFGSKLAANGISWIICANGIRWKLDLRNPTHRWCVYDSIFTPGVAKWIRRHLRTGGIVIDSGANIGQAVIDFAAYPQCEVHAFEPLPEATAWLRDCISRAGLMNVNVINDGLYSTVTRLELQIAGHEDVHGAHSTLRQDWYSSQNNERIWIELTTLDDYAQAHGIDAIRFWKLDIEGSELDALKGAESLLGSKFIQALYIEMNSPEQSEIPNYLSGLGYVPMNLDSSGVASELSAPISKAGDYLFLPT